MLELPHSARFDGTAQAAVTPLRLAASRGQLGLELYHPLRLGPVQLIGLSIALPNLRFPLDLSGGVQSFRHRRGLLQHMRLHAPFRELSAWLYQAWRAALGGLTQPPDLWPAQDGLRIGLLGQSAALGFDLLWAPDDAAGRLIVDNARGAGSVGVALGTALALMDTVLARVTSRQGRVYVAPELGARVVRSVLPAVGVRAPQVRQGRVSTLRCDTEGVSFAIDDSLTPPLLADNTLRLLDLSRLVREGDDALAAGELDSARNLYLSGLERAPRHPHIARLIAEIDVAVGDRNQAALGLLRETVPLHSAGAIAGGLLAEAGELPAAREAFDNVARSEPYAPLASLWLLQLAQVETDARDRLNVLDRAVALAPALARVRRARLQARAQLGEVNSVLADAQHLEAAAQGASARHDELCWAAQALLAGGRIPQAGQLFERALRYLPDDPQATLGLARAFLSSGQQRRAVALFERAVALAQSKQQINAEALLELGRVVAQQLGDLPQAVATVRQVPSDCEQAGEARVLEAEWLSELGDVAGASLAYARLRQAVELTPPQHPEQGARWLIVASRFEQGQQDLFAAERHAAIALRLSPRDPQLQIEYREVAGRLAAQRRRERS